MHHQQLLFEAISFCCRVSCLGVQVPALSFDKSQPCKVQLKSSEHHKEVSVTNCNKLFYATVTVVDGAHKTGWHILTDDTHSHYHTRHSCKQCKKFVLLNLPSLHGLSESSLWRYGAAMATCKTCDWCLPHRYRYPRCTVLRCSVP
jgi:hypothetical protein